MQNFNARRSKKTLFIDASNLGVKNGERIILDQKDIDYLTRIVRSFRKGIALPQVEPLVRLLSSKDIEANDFNFLYNEIEPEKERRPSEMILTEIEALQKKRLGIQQALQQELKELDI